MSYLSFHWSPSCFIKKEFQSKTRRWRSKPNTGSISDIFNWEKLRSWNNQEASIHIAYTWTFQIFKNVFPQVHVKIGKICLNTRSGLCWYLYIYYPLPASRAIKTSAADVLSDRGACRHKSPNLLNCIFVYLTIYIKKLPSPSGGVSSVGKFCRRVNWIF